MKIICLLVVCVLAPAVCFANNYAFDVAIMNFEQTDETTIEWDLHIRKAAGSEDFALYMMDVVLAFNNDILNTGNFENDDFIIAAIGPDMNQYKEFFMNYGCTLKGSPPNRQLHWSVVLPPQEGNPMTIISGDWLQLARFRLQLTKDGNPHHFACADAAFTFLAEKNQPVLYRAKNTSETYDGQGSEKVPLNTTIPEAGVAKSDRQLSGYYFSGNGNWNDSKRWNTATAAHANTIPDKPSQNAIITGSATINNTVNTNQLSIQSKQVELPTVKTGELDISDWEIGFFHVRINEILCHGSSPVNEFGIIYGDNPSVSLSNKLNIFKSESTMDTYYILQYPGHEVMEGHYFRAYAISSVGIAYGRAYRVSDLQEGEGPVGGLTDMPVRLTIAPTGQLTANAIHNEVGAEALVLQSSEAATASLILSHAETEATVQQYIPASTGWQEKSPAPCNWYWISPPTGQQDISEYLSVLSPDEDYDLYLWDETADLWLNHKGTNFKQQHFQRGEGYLFAAQGAATYTYTGTLHSGSLTWEGLTRGSTTAEHGPGWHLIGNPYASGLQFNSDHWSSATVSYTPQYWVESEGSYSAWTEGQVIPPSMAFFVEALENNATLTIDQAAQAHPATEEKSNPEKESAAVNDYIILAATPYNDSSHDKLSVNLSGESHKEQPAGGNTLQRAYIRLAPDLADGFDNRYHSRFRPGDAPRFFSVSNGNRLLVNAVRYLDPALTIPFYFKKNNESNTFKIELERSITDSRIYLTDLKLDKTQLLTPSQPYVFQSSPTDDPMRFILGFDDTVNTGLVTEQTAENEVWTHGSELHLLLKDDDTRIVLYDTKGRKVRRYRAHAGRHRFRPKLSAGVYLLQLKGQDQVHTRKIILK